MRLLPYGGRRGKPIGPDLSNVARELTVDQIRQALLQPSAEIAAGYSLVTLRMRDGTTLRGFVRNRTRFDIQLQDLKGALHPVPLDRVSAVEDEKQSLMPAGNASPGELQNVIAYLSSLSGRYLDSRRFTRNCGGGNRFLRNAESEAGRLGDLQRKPDGNRYSELKQIDAAT